MKGRAVCVSEGGGGAVFFVSGVAVFSGPVHVIFPVLD